MTWTLQVTGTMTNKEWAYRGGMNAWVFNGIDVVPFTKNFPQYMMINF